MKHGGVEYYSLVTTCWHAPPRFNIFGQHPDINIDRLNIDRLLLLVTGDVLPCMDQVIIHKMRKHTHAAWAADLEFGVDTFILYKSISLFHSLNRMGRFTILVINK